MLDLPNPADLKPTHLTTFTVKAGGTALDGSYAVEAIEIAREVNRIPRATIILQDGASAKQDFEISSETTLLPGVEIEILGGYSSTEAVLFKGIVTRHRIELGKRRSRLVIECKDAAVRMTLARISRSFADQSDGDVIEGLIGGWPGLTADVQLLGSPLPQIVQHQASDWDFMVMRAEVNSAFVIVIDGKVSVAAPMPAGLTVARAIFGQGLKEALLELDAEAELAIVETGAWDPAGQDLLTAETEDSATNGPGDVAGTDLAEVGGAKAELRHPGARYQAALDGWAAAAMARGRRASVRGTVTVQGS
jgi:phage protein D